jgi:BioD-like phosphotransacetylase family protein
MSHIYISSTGNHAGLTLVIWAIARRLMEKKYHPGFFKPFGTGTIKDDDTGIDNDVFLFKEILHLKEPMELINPCPDSEVYKKSYNQSLSLDKIKNTLSTILNERDILLIAGSGGIFSDSKSNVISDISLIEELETDLVLVNRFQKVSTSIYSILSVHSLLKDRLKGVVINRIPAVQLEEIREKIIPVLKQKEISNIALLAEDPYISMRSIKEIAEILGGTIICGNENLDRPVNTLTVGSSCLPGGLKVFKRVYNKIILLGPSDEHPEIAGMLLTANRDIPESVIEIAREFNIPLILVEKDLFFNWELLQNYMSRFSTRDENKVTHFMEMMDHDGFLDRLIESI